MIKKFKSFLNEEVNFRYNNIFRDFLINDNSDISKFIISLNNKEIDISFTNLDIDMESDNMLKFNPEDKKIKNTYLLDDRGISLEFLCNKNKYLLTHIDGWVFPDRLPENYIEPGNKYTLVKILKHDLSTSKTEEVDNLNIVKNQMDIKYVILKGDNDINYIFSVGQFNSYFTKLDYKENRNEKANVGRLINKILKTSNYKFDQKELENFVNRYKAYKKLLDGDVIMEVINGEDIKKWYNEENYSNGSGHLNKSCMRYDYCQEYFDIYINNPQVCEMLILYTDETKIGGRALLWTLIDGRKVMDRIYTTSDSFVEFFKKWGSENGYIQREQVGKGTIQLNRYDSYEKYPYLDTFCYYDPSSKRLSNDFISKDQLILNDTEGYYLHCDYCNGEGRVDCYECSGNGCEDCHGDGWIDCPECT